MDVPPPSKFARFRFFKEPLPRHLPDGFIGLSQELAMQIEKEPPPTINEVILHVTQTMIKRNASFDVYVYGSFRSRFRAIDEFADYLVPLYMRSGILPLVKPLTKSEWALHYQKKGPALLRISRSGWLLNRLGKSNG